MLEPVKILLELCDQCLLGLLDLEHVLIHVLVEPLDVLVLLKDIVFQEHCDLTELVVFKSASLFGGGKKEELELW